MPMNLPFVCFKCGHGFHNLCLGIFGGVNDKVNCRKCKDKKNKLNDTFKNNKIFYNTINTIDKLEKQLDNNKDKIDFIHRLYGKGLFNLGSIKDNKLEHFENI